jgi:hypothetical protein
MSTLRMSGFWTISFPVVAPIPGRTVNTPSGTDNTLLELQDDWSKAQTHLQLPQLVPQTQVQIWVPACLGVRAIIAYMIHG